MNSSAYEYLARMVIADGQIDDRESLLLQSFMKEANAADDAYQNVQSIFADQGSQNSLDQLIHSIRKEYDNQSRREIITMGYMIALIDDYLDPAEEAALELSRQTWDITVDEMEQIKSGLHSRLENEKSALRPEDNEETAHPFFYSKMAEGILKVAARLTRLETRERIQGFQTKLLLNGPEYSKAIEVCGKIAESDYKYVHPILEQSEKILHNLLTNIQHTVERMPESKDEELDVKGSIYALQQAIQDKLQPQIAQQQQSLLKKKRSMHSFTISFLGKTKAGKSTLHAIVTGEGEEAIGKGKQRTTRFNRVYNWKNIRIIDTPGIGAPGGKSDEEIAASIIDESDMVCYVLKNDSIQESEFKFLGAVREKNKPFTILLNLKENLLHEVRLNEFLQNPEFMYRREDEKSIKGHIDRIRRYATEHYAKDMFEIIPVQLLAAQMSRMESYAPHADVLFKASHVGLFLDSIRLAIIEDGAIRRSQTILDGTFFTIESARKVVHDQRKELNNIVKKLTDSRIKSKKMLEQNFKKYSDLIEKHIKTQFSQLRGQVTSFANQYYSDNQDTIEQAWTKLVRTSNFDPRIRKGVEEQITGYMAEIETYFHEFAENLALSEEMLQSKGVNIQKIGTFSSRNLLRLLAAGGGILGVLMISNPVGWIIGGIAGLVGLFAGLLKSKQTKIREAIEKLEASLFSSIQEQEEAVLQNTAKHFESIHVKMSGLLNNYFDHMIKATTNIKKQITEVDKELTASATRLNNALGWRILNYAKQPKSLPTDINDTLIANSVTHVERNFGKSIIIHTTERISEQRAEIVSKKIQERVIIPSITKTHSLKEHTG